MAWRRGQALSQDLRDRVLGAAGDPSRQVAARFGVSISYVVKARQRLRRLGDSAPGAQRSHTPAKLAGHDEALRAEVERRPDATLVELRAWALSSRGVLVSISALSVRLRRLGLTLKKSRWPRPSSFAPMSPRRAEFGRS